MHTQTHIHKNPHANPQTGPITVHCAAASLARSVINKEASVTAASDLGHRDLNDL